MCNYFAKYLPVEGEIKEGDLHLNKLTGTIEPASKNVAANWSNNFSYNDGTRFLRDDYKKVKLFLCSRDIQVGDKVKFQLVPNKTPWKELEVEEVYGFFGIDKTAILKDGDFKIHTTPDNFCFKVIGEISPEATWVKEGDEFDDTECEGYYGTGGNIIEEGKLRGKRISVIFNWRLDTDNEILERLKIKENPEFRIIYKIKGPCGHFH
jgi:hypothetical protein